MIFTSLQSRIEMVEAENTHVKLNEAILRVRAPVFGAKTIDELWFEHISDILEITKTSDAATVAFLHQIIRRIVITCRGGLRRNIANYFDAQPPFQLEKPFVSGSWSEALHVLFGSSLKIKPPDVDFMCVLKNIKFTETDQIEGNLTVRDDTPFVNAYITDEGCAELWKDFLHEPSSSKQQLSSLKLKEKFHRNYSDVGNFFQLQFLDASQVVQGEPECASFKIDIDTPRESTRSIREDCIKSFFDTLFNSRQDFYQEIRKNIFKVFYNRYSRSCDIVLALSCAGWPLSANEWITRARMWPGEDLVKRIAQAGFHIVPKISPEGDFRLSFSTAETTLIKHWSPFQHKVVKAFKAVVKYYQHIWSNSNINKIITTYHLKTIAFWYFEKRSQNSFTAENVATHLVLLLQELAEALRKQELPMYFMPKVNLLKDIENYEEVIDMVDKIFHLSTNVSAIKEVVEKITETKLSATADEVYFKYLEWNYMKQTKRSNVENRLLPRLLQNDQAQSEDDLEKINLDGYRFLFTIACHFLFYESK